MADTPGKPRIAQACRPRLVNCSGRKRLPAAPLPWLTATQTPRSCAVQAGTAAGEARPVSAASAAPDELAAKAAVVAISPATDAAATTAVTRRAVFGMLEMRFMMVVPSWPGMRCLRRPVPFKTAMTALRLGPGRRRRPVGQTSAVTGRAELTRRAQAHGVAVSYQNWRGRHVEVPDETLAAVLEALDDERCPAAAKAPTPGAVAPFPRRRS